jgi:hypothetical protein
MSEEVENLSQRVELLSAGSDQATASCSCS